MVMAVYGWWQWTDKTDKKEVKIHFWALKTHTIIAVASLILTPAVGRYMAYLGASFPYLDAFVAILSVIATVMVTKKVFENWYYWLLIDSLSIYLFWQKQLYFVAALYVVYLILIVVGIKAWNKALAQQKEGLS
jgi:nicotinamide mononucleotide transporter